MDKHLLLTLTSMRGTTYTSIMAMAFSGVKSPSDFSSVGLLLNNRELVIYQTIAYGIESYCELNGIQIIGCFDEEYPDRLGKVYDVPVILYLRGNAKIISNKKMVAVVGTHKPTDFGQEKAFEIGVALAREGFTVVSGLTTCCDIAVHKGCISAGGQTVAVVAHGLDSIHLKENDNYANEIVKSGCIVSELPPGENCKPYRLLARDKIISGLSAGVIVVEQDVKEGTTHTVDFAWDQGKPVGCIKHPVEYISSPSTFGNQRLLKFGRITPLANEEDVNLFIKRLL